MSNIRKILDGVFMGNYVGMCIMKKMLYQTLDSTAVFNTKYYNTKHIAVL